MVILLTIVVEGPTQRGRDRERQHRRRECQGRPPILCAPEPLPSSPERIPAEAPQKQRPMSSGLKIHSKSCQLVIRGD